MLLPYHVDVPMVRLPIANWILIAVTCVISLAILLEAFPDSEGPTPQELPDFRKSVSKQNVRPTDPKRDRPVIESTLGAPAPPPLALMPARPAPLQFLSYLFVHGDLMHLLGNMVFLFLFGNAVNAKLGHGLFLLCYLLFGAVAGLAFLLVGDARPVVGASRAVMGLMGLFLVLFPRNEVRVFYWLGMIGWGVFYIATGWVIVFYLICDLGGAVFDAGGAVAYVAHLAGGVVGIGLGIDLVSSGWIQSTEYEENLLQVVGWQQKEARTDDLLWSPRKRSKERRG